MTVEPSFSEDLPPRDFDALGDHASSEQSIGTGTENFMTGYCIVFNKEKHFLGWKKSNLSEGISFSLLQLDTGIPPRIGSGHSHKIVIWFVIPATRSPQADHNNNALALIVLIQYVPGYI